MHVGSCVSVFSKYFFCYRGRCEMMMEEEKNRTIGFFLEKSRHFAQRHGLSSSSQMRDWQKTGFYA
jgi:hypothetical protein